MQIDLGASGGRRGPAVRQEEGQFVRGQWACSEQCQHVTQVSEGVEVQAATG